MLIRNTFSDTIHRNHKSGKEEYNGENDTPSLGSKRNYSNKCDVKYSAPSISE
jgi:hypothetical protein